jgi:hypothetical protein
MVTLAPGTGEGGRHAQFAGVLPEKPETQYIRKWYLSHRGQGREAGMHSLLVSCQRNLRDTVHQKMVTFAPGTGLGGRHAQFASVLPEKPETRYEQKMVTFAPGTGLGGRHALFTGVLPEKPETQ